MTGAFKMGSKSAATLSLTAVLLFCPSCKKALDRATASRLAAGQSMGNVWMAVNFIPENNNREYYHQLAAQGVLQCQPTFGAEECRPGPNGPGMVMDMGEIRFVAGNLVTGEVTGVSQGGESGTATATVPIRFQPTGLYSRYQSLFDQMRAAQAARFSDKMGQSGRTIEANFRFYDDGWRLQPLR